MIATLLKHAFSELALHPAGLLLAHRKLLLVDLLGFLAVELALE